MMNFPIMSICTPYIHTGYMYNYIHTFIRRYVRIHSTLHTYTPTMYIYCILCKYVHGMYKISTPTHTCTYVRMYVCTYVVANTVCTYTSTNCSAASTPTHIRTDIRTCHYAATHPTHLWPILWMVPEDQCPSSVFGSVLESDCAPHGHVTAGKVTKGSRHRATSVT